MRRETGKAGRETEVFQKYEQYTGPEFVSKQFRGIFPFSLPPRGRCDPGKKGGRREEKIYFFSQNALIALVC